MDEYHELHCRSAFSFLRGASLPEALAREAGRLALPGLAVLDRDGVYGAPRLYGAAREAGVQPIVGAEVTLADGAVLPLLCESRTGYRNLCRLLTQCRREPRPPRCPALTDATDGQPPEAGARKRPCAATWAELEAHAEGLVALTGDEHGPLARAWRSGGPAALATALAPLQRIFGPGERLFVEIQRHGVRGEASWHAALRDLATATGLPLLATGGAAYATPAERPVADVFTCLRHHTTLDEAGLRLGPHDGRHLRSPLEMQARFVDLPEAIAQSGRLARRLAFTLRDLGYRFPDYPVGPGETMAGVLRERTLAGAAERWGATLPPGTVFQLERELALIEKLGFGGYFLIVWDICRWCRERGILVQGRGSAANSAVCYALHITAVDPIRHRLLFERFLSEGRVGADGHPSWPDIDLDLPSGDLREAVLQEVYRRYAPRSAALVANVICYRGRSAAREAGKVLGLPSDVVERFSSLFAGGDYPHTLGLAEQAKLAGLPAHHPRFAALVQVYQRLQKLPRHLGQHPGGMVLAGGRLDDIVPVEPATMEARTIVQWDKDDCEELGLVKVDFLGLGMMAAMQETFALCAARGRPCTLPTIPTDDAATFAAMQEADTIGVFQIESRAQMSTIRRFRPANFYDVAMEVALVRPGPIVGQVAHPLLQRRAGLEPVVHLHSEVSELLRPVLERTYGVVLFQEQMLQVAMILAGFTGTQAEELRRSLGFARDTTRLVQVLEHLRTAMAERGHSPAVIEAVVQSASSFSLYGFPESHALSFGLLAYASTWLKVHRPVEFLTSLLNAQPMGFYSPATLIQDARRHGLRILPTCVAASEWRCTVVSDTALRLGLCYVKGLRKEAVHTMLAERARASFADLPDWLARTAFSPAERRALASVGALNTLCGHRRAALWQAEAAWRPDEDLFRHLPAPDAEVPLPLAAMSPIERIQADFAGLDLTVGAHPMALARPGLPPDLLRAGDLPYATPGQRVRVGGSVICRQRPGTAKGFVFVSLEDETGVANCIFAPALYEKLRLVLNEEPTLVVTGRLQNQEGIIHVQARAAEALRLPELPTAASHDFH